MDPEKEQQPAPDQLRKLSEPARQFLNALEVADIEALKRFLAIKKETQEWLVSFDKEKLERAKRWDGAITWIEGLGYVGKVGFVIVMALFGLWTSFLVIYDRLFTRLPP